MISLRKIVCAFAVLIALDLLAAAPSSAGQDNLIEASAAGDLSRVKALIAAKADMNAKLANGGTALMAASQNGRLGP